MLSGGARPQNCVCYISTPNAMLSNTNQADKILVVDDDARIRDLLRRYLIQEGFEVLLAEDGKAMTRTLLRQSVDLIVLDLMMPGEDGLSIAAACAPARIAHPSSCSRPRARTWSASSDLRWVRTTT